MTDKNRKSALASLQEDMSVETLVRTDIKTSNSDLGENKEETKPIKRAKGKIVSNIPWYPKSAILKK